MDSWLDLVHNNNAAIIAQSIYGESFEVTGAKEGELNQQYTFALYAADKYAEL